jgi:hypothetical protein
MTTVRRSPPSRRGAVLIIVLGVLAVLALLATTFATLQGTERRVARNHADTVRARLLAQSGVEAATARLRELFPGRVFSERQPWKYWGSDRTETKEVSGVPLDEAVNPSFAIEAKAGNAPENPEDPTDSNVTPLTIRIEGRDRGLSGVAPGTYALHGDNYALRVSDLSGRLHVNDGVDGGAEGSVSQNTKRILNVLGRTLSPVIPDLGDRLLARRPKGGYRALEDLREVLADDFDRVREFLTVHAWVDRNVANPVPLSAAMAGAYPVRYDRGSPAIYRFMSSQDASGREIVPPEGLRSAPTAPIDDPSIRVYGMDTLNPQWIEIVSRAPVNVNSASREVLVALLADLRGFFLTDRRRNNPNWNSTFYSVMGLQSSFSPGSTEGGEVGYLVETLPVTGPGGTATGGVSAYVLADEILACRLKRASANFNYASVPWGGPFRNWTQFNLFVDNLARPKSDGGAGVLLDPRPLFFDYDTETEEPTGFGPLVASEFQRRHAAQAVADAIKANFNPNLHLNEANPDENLFLVVDKTDLIVHSTEFTFLPTGYFEVESLGRVLHPLDPEGKDAYAGDNGIAAQARIRAVVKLYDLYRETNQKQFYAGTPAPRSGAYETNNDKAVEIGPEPDNGVFPGNHGASGDPDNEWGGYLALPTVGGPAHGGARGKPPNTLVRSQDLPAERHFGSAMHVHFAYDFDAHHHVLDRREIAGRELPDEAVVNFPDRSGGTALAYGGPYDPTKGPENAHRLARSFRRPEEGNTTTAAPRLEPLVPSDLRIDGGYCERHASPAYLTSTTGGSIWNFSTEKARGMVSFWYKPSYFPELTGKVRVPWDLSRLHHCPAHSSGGYYPFPFVLWFFPTHFDPETAESSKPVYAQGHQCHPCSFVFGSLQWHASKTGPISWYVNDVGEGKPNGHSFGNASLSLNHLSHPDRNDKPSPLRGHRWINVAFSWSLPGGLDSRGTMSKMFVNGTTAYVPFNRIRNDPMRFDKMMYWETHDQGEFNHMRLGAPSQIAKAAINQGNRGARGAYSGNHAADGTIDELYVWKSEEDADPRTLWMRGRYAIPKGTEGRFHSQALPLKPAGARTLPPTAVASGRATVAAPSGSLRILGLAWTWYGEATDPATGKPSLLDHATPTIQTAPKDLKPRVRVGIEDGDLLHGPYDEDGYSDVRTSSGSAPVIQDPTRLKYVVQFEVLEAGVSTVLLASPVLDDVTIYWQDGDRSPYVSYVIDGRTF